MAAGDLENILMTAPDSTMHSSRVRNIIWRDNNNVNRSVKYVYWCPDGVTAKLVWQRDHTPVVVSYTTLKSSGSDVNRQYLFKYVATTNAITTINIWSSCTEGNPYNAKVYVYDSNFNRIYSNAVTPSIIVASLNIDGTTRQINEYSFSPNVNGLTSGKTYYIYANFLYHDNVHIMPYVVSNGANTYPYYLINLTDDQIESSNTLSPSQYDVLQASQPKIEINGAQI
jgi:hypothetical protein